VEFAHYRGLNIGPPLPNSPTNFNVLRNCTPVVVQELHRRLKAMALGAFASKQNSGWTLDESAFTTILL
jgi:hypothetical protein